MHDLFMTFGNKVETFIAAFGQLGMHMEEYRFESQMLGPINQVQENAVNVLRV